MECVQRVLQKKINKIDIMLSPRLTNCPECSDIPSLLKKIDCKLAELGNNLYNNISYMLNKPVPADDITQLIGYRRILMYKRINPSYVQDYSVAMIASRVIRLTVGCVSRCNTPEPCIEESCDITIVPNPTSTTTSTTLVPITTTTSSSTSTSTSSSTTTTTTTGAPVTIYSYVTTCNSYTWDVTGLTYTDSDEISYTEGNVTNVLYLTICSGTGDQIYVDTVTAVSPYIWPITGEYYYFTGSFYYGLGRCPNGDAFCAYYLELTIIDPTTTTTTSSSSTTTSTSTSTSTSTTTTTNTTLAPIIIKQYEVACQEYTWPVTGITYTDSDEITETVGNVTNILYLTVLPGTSDETVVDTVTSTSPYTWFNGQEYTASGNYSISYPCNGFSYTFFLELTII